MSAAGPSPRWRFGSLLFGFTVALSGLVIPPPDGLSPEGLRAITLLAGAIVLWVLQPIDLAATALLGMAGIALLGVLPPGEAFALFGNQAVFFVLGVFLLAAVLIETGLATRAALTLMSRFDRSPAQLSTAVLLMAVSGCLFLVSHAVAAILFPILLEVCRALGLGHGESSYARRLLLSMAWGSIVGSNLTFLSSVRIGLALGLLAQFEADRGSGDGISFLFWMAGSTLVVVTMTVVVAAVLARYHPPEELDMRPAIELLQSRVRAMGPLRSDEYVALFSLVLMLVGMVSHGQTLGFGTVALGAACVNFVGGSTAFSAAEKNVSWSIFLLFGGAVAMATALERTGGVEWLADTLFSSGRISPWVLVAVVSYLCIVLTEFASNSAVIAALLPICFVLAEQAGLQPRAMVFVTVIPAGLAFVLPTGTPAMAMVFSSGYLKPRDTVVPGLILIHLSWLLMLLVAWLWWPVIGLR